MDKSVSVIIVNYNSGTLIDRCLTSLKKQTYSDLEIIVVDNASSDGSIDHAAAFDNLLVIHNESNVGFAAAQNQGMAHAHGHYFMPLNFDVDLDERFIEEMVNGIETSVDVGWVCGKHLAMEEDGTHLNAFYSTGHLLPPNRFPVHRGAGDIDTGQFDTPGVIFGAPGVAPLYKRKMLEDIAIQGQYFDETYFTWWEDVDLDWRANLRGWKCQYVPGAIIYHVGTESTVRSDLHLGISIRNRWLMVATNEEFGFIIKNACSLIIYEVALLKYVIVHQRYRAYLIALSGLAKKFLYIARKRRWVMRNKRVKSETIPFFK